jgi:hypothetical protein
LLPFSSREKSYRGYLFKLSQASAGEQTLYLRLQSSSSSLLLLRLWQPEAFFSRVPLEYGLIFASISLLLTVLLLNINAWFWLRDNLSLWFIAYLAVLIVLFAGNAGLLQQYVYPESSQVNNLVVGLAAILSMALGHAFYRQLFLVDRQQPLLNGITVWPSGRRCSAYP